VNFFADKEIFFTYGFQDETTPAIGRGVAPKQRKRRVRNLKGGDDAMARTATKSNSWFTGKRRPLILAAGVLAVIVVIAFDTTVVRIGSSGDLRQQAFDPDAFGETEFPRIQALVIDRAPDAVTLATELDADKQAAIETYGTVAGAFPVLPVAFTGVAGEGRSGIFGVDIAGLPDGMTVRVQTGPAINGTELRDIPGDIDFGAFTNQIEYQDAGAGINRAMAAETLSDIDRETLSGETISVTGVFTMINAKNWLVTPVSIEVD
jgi:predicted lipoprotein